ncbi:MAG TPA: hypothetical protein VNT79_12035 [Phycisphaerae bacterium]|nr:hypothetical protein [Phycisphaerae bacterium]
MLAGGYQVVDVLMLVLCIGPVASYFLTLGLVNSHARPWLISSRSDFVSLTSVLIPLLIWPLPMLATGGQWWLLIAAAVVVTAVFIRMLPAATAGFVIYNISARRCRFLVSDAINAMAWAGKWDDNAWRAADGRMTITLRALPPLRNVTVHIESAANHAAAARRIQALRVEIEDRFHSVSQMPSTMGACLVMLGVGLMIIPMWMVSRHIDDLVDAMSHLFG